MIRDQIVFGICDKKVREGLLRESELTLDHAVELCQSSELVRQQVIQFNVSSATSSPNAAAAIDAISFRDKKLVNTRSFRGTDNDTFLYKRCGSKHKFRQCPAFGKRCYKCNGLNHFAKMRLSKESKMEHRMLVVEDTDDSDSLSDSLYVQRVSEEDTTPGEAEAVSIEDSVQSSK